MYLHDVAYSHCGRRLATCGSDQRITVWNKCSSSGVAPGSAAAATVAAAAAGGWTRAAAWAAHCGPVWRVAWAPPAFGAILASASADHTVLLWEECVPASASAAAAAAAGGGAAPAPVWQQRAQLNDARGGVRAVCWAPRHLGLRLAAGSADGGVRVYEAVDAAASLAHWSLDAFDAEPEAAGGVAALAWATGPADAPLIAVGGGSGVTKVRRRAPPRAGGGAGRAAERARQSKCFQPRPLLRPRLPSAHADMGLGDRGTSMVADFGAARAYARAGHCVGARCGSRLPPRGDLWRRGCRRRVAVAARGRRRRRRQWRRR